jgi:hypothetical protein
LPLQILILPRRLVGAIKIVKQWRLKAGDKLDWSLEARKNEVTIVVRMAESRRSEG